MSGPQQDSPWARPGHDAVLHCPTSAIYKRCRKGAQPFTAPCPRGWRPLHPGHETGRISPCQEAEHWHWDPAGEGDFLVQLALAHRCGGLGGEGLQGLSLLTVALGCSGDTAPVPFPPGCPSLYCCDNRHPKPTGPFAAPGEPLVSLHNSWQGRLKGNSSSPGGPQACQDGGKLSAGQDTGSSLHQRAKSWTNLEGNSSKDIKQPQNRSPVPSLTTRSLPRLWVTLPHAATTSPTSSHSLYPAPCKLPHPMPPQLPGHLGLEEPCLLPHRWGTLRGLLSSHHPETTASALLLISSAFGRASCCPAAGATRTRASHVLLDIPAQHYSGSSC